MKYVKGSEGQILIHFDNCPKDKVNDRIRAPSFRELFDRAQQESSVDHEWTLDEINAEIKASRLERSLVCMQ